MSLTETKCDCITYRKPKYTGEKPTVTVNYCDQKFMIYIFFNIDVVGDAIGDVGDVVGDVARDSKFALSWH